MNFSDVRYLLSHQSASPMNLSGALSYLSWLQGRNRHRMAGQPDARFNQVQGAIDGSALFAANELAHTPGIAETAIRQLDSFDAE